LKFACFDVENSLEMSKVQRKNQAIVIRQGQQIRSFQQKTIGNFLGRFKSILLGSAENRIRNIEQQRQLNNLARLSKILMCPQQLEYFQTLAGDKRLVKIIFWAATLGLQPVFVDNKIKLALTDEMADLKLQGYKGIGEGARKVIQFETVSSKIAQIEPWQETIVEFSEKYEQLLKKQKVTDSILKVLYGSAFLVISASQVVEIPPDIVVPLFISCFIAPLMRLNLHFNNAKKIIRSMGTAGNFNELSPGEIARFLMELGKPQCENGIIKYLLSDQANNHKQIKNLVANPQLLPGLEGTSLPAIEAGHDIPRLTSGSKEDESDGQD
jgi:hypothetical protein